MKLPNREYSITFYDQNEDLADITVWAFDIKEAKRTARGIKFWIQNLSSRPAGRGPIKTIVHRKDY